MKRVAVQVGQHYLSVEGGYFGGPGPEWEVVSVVELNVGVTCARLAMTRDPTEQAPPKIGGLRGRDCDKRPT